LIDSAPIIKDGFNLDLRLDPGVGCIELSPQPVGRPIQIAERVF
jgi:hypothetical protein